MARAGVFSDCKSNENVRSLSQIHRMKFHMSTIIRYLVLLWTLFGVGIAYSAEKKVLLVVSKSSEMYLEIVNVVESQLIQQYKGDVTIQKVNVPEMEDGQDHKAYQDMDLVISIGTKAARIVAKWKSTRPRFFIFVPKSSLTKILSESPDSDNKNSYGIYLDQPFSRELSLTKILLSGVKSAGVLLGSITQAEKSEIIKLGKRVGFDLEFAKVSDETNNYASSRSLIDRSDVILTLPDPVALSPQRAKWLLYQSYQNKVPIISFSQSFVKAGALAAVYSTPKQIGWQAGEVAIRIMNNPGGGQRFFYPSYFDVAVNRTVAHSLGLDIADEDSLVKSIQRLEHVYN